MKLTVLLLTCFALNVHANGFGQNVSLSGKALPLEKVFQELKKQTGYVFLYYPDDLLKNAKAVTIDATSMPLRDFLTQVFKDQPYQFFIRSKSVLISRAAIPEKLADMYANAMVEVVLKGRILNAEGKPLSGVSIIIKETKEGVTSDQDGNFSLPAFAGGTLVFNYVGYESKELKVEAESFLTVVLTEKNIQLSEVVVNGYTAVSRRSSGGAYSTLSGEKIENAPVTSFDQVLGGKVTGLNITNSSGLLGAPVIMRIRGVSSISSGSQPLIVVDGVPIVQGDIGLFNNSVNPLADINPNDIERIDVLKDASAVAVYGSRGAAGVIVVTTRQGKSGVQRVSYDTYFGISQAARKIKVLGGDTYNRIVNLKRTNAGLSAIAAYADYNADGQPDAYSTDWQNEVYRNGNIMNHQLSVAGGTAKTTYFTSAGYQDFGNYIQSNRNKKITARLNATHTANRWLKLGLNTQYARNRQYGLGAGTGNNNYGIPFGPLLYFPNVPVSLNDSYYKGLGGNSLDLGTIVNPAALLSESYDNFRSGRFIASGFAELSLLQGLKYKTTYGVDYLNGFETAFYSPDFGPGVSYNGLAQNFYSEYNLWNWTNLLTYNKMLGRNVNLNAYGGIEYNKYEKTVFTGTANNLTDPFYSSFIGSAFTQTSANGSLGENGLSSYFLTTAFTVKQKYAATLSFRSDAYSGFGWSHKRGYFPSAALGWNFTEEALLRDQNIISDGKLRISYGLTGNSNIGDFPALQTYSAVTYGDLGGSALNNAGNADLRWEKTKQWNAGASFTLLKRLDVVMDYYQKRTSDLILANPVAATLGFPGNTITENIGVLTNNGAELSLSWRGKETKKLQWRVGLNLSYNKSKVVATNNAGADVAEVVNLARPGEALGVYYLVRWAGVNAETGFAQFLDKDGVMKMYDPASKVWTNPQTGETVTAISSADRVVHSGKTFFPTFQGGVNGQVSYKNIQLSVELQFASDFYRYNTTMQGLLAQNNRNNAVGILDSWTTPGQQAANQKLYYGDAVSTQASTRWLERADFIRGKNISLSYSLPQTITDKTTLASIRFFVQVQNAFTITGYTGIDPEANQLGNTNIGGGQDNFRPYLSRTMTLGASILF